MANKVYDEFSDDDFSIHGFKPICNELESAELLKNGMGQAFYN